MYNKNLYFDLGLDFNLSENARKKYKYLFTFSKKHRKKPQNQSRSCRRR